ncbi:hypothetical protein Q361_11264 [Flavobacterium croceum DSM 17960]|uniref:Transmembrane protein n=1 Tax=Flavobacterium croceum DSM 17960 TaxID=1121886 RepID=A0A2S4N6F9_9FLAO|nr:hypothetical protein [Flavobacterium croceum]POS01260.1 hypothetical protein Q361_11264 [Flavobacterium croceum DSM 17960]
MWFSKKILPFFSYLFHPIFTAFFGTLWYIFYSENYAAQQQGKLLIFQVVIITCLLPMAFLQLLKLYGRVDSLMVSDVNQRKMPLLMQMALTSVLLQKTITLDLFPELYFYFLGGILSALVVFVLIFFKIKASIHMMGMSALSIFMICISITTQQNNFYSIALVFFCTGLVASSRLALHAHTNKELIIGYFCGLLPQLMLMYFWL